MSDGRAKCAQCASNCVQFFIDLPTKYGFAASTFWPAETHLLYLRRTESITNIPLNIANYWPGMLTTAFSVIIVDPCECVFLSHLLQVNAEYFWKTKEKKLFLRNKDSLVCPRRKWIRVSLYNVDGCSQSSRREFLVKVEKKSSGFPLDFFFSEEVWRTPAEFF